MNRDKVLTWLRGHASEPVMFSNVSRALITNSHKQRARSREARQELRLTLASLQAEGHVALTSGRNGRPGTVIQVIEKKGPR